MTEVERQIEDLTARLQDLRSRQMQLNTEMVAAERILQSLRAIFLQENREEKVIIPPATFVEQQTTDTPAPPISQHTIDTPYILQAKLHVEEKNRMKQRQQFHVNKEMEDFIETNDISKVGILVTIIG